MHLKIPCQNQSNVIEQVAGPWGVSHRRSRKSCPPGTQNFRTWWDAHSATLPKHTNLVTVCYSSWDPSAPFPNEWLKRMVSDILKINMVPHLFAQGFCEDKLFSLANFPPLPRAHLADSLHTFGFYLCPSRKKEKTLQKFWKSIFQVVCTDSTGKLFRSSPQKNCILSPAGLFPQMWKLIIEATSPPSLI